MVKFVRGVAANYNSTTYADGIYFATDTQNIILNGVEYGAGAVTGDIADINAKIGTVAEGSTIVGMISAAQTAATYDDTALAARVSANETAIATLNGTASAAGSVAYQVAQAVAGIVAGADASYDTLKEIADWILSDTTGAAKMNSDIQTLKSAVGAAAVLYTAEDDEVIGGTKEVGDVKTAATGLYKAISDEAAARAAADTAINNKIGTVTSGKTVVEMISDAQTAATYDDTTVKSYTVNSKTISTNPVLNGADIALTGYTTTSISGSVAATDTINAAIAKVEVKADAANTALTWIEAA